MFGKKRQSPPVYHRSPDISNDVLKSMVSSVFEPYGDDSTIRNNIKTVIQSRDQFAHLIKQECEKNYMITLGSLCDKSHYVVLLCLNRQYERAKEILMMSIHDSKHPMIEFNNKDEVKIFGQMFNFLKLISSSSVDYEGKFASKPIRVPTVFMYRRQTEDTDVADVSTPSVIDTAYDQYVQISLIFYIMCVDSDNQCDLAEKRRMFMDVLGFDMSYVYEYDYGHDSFSILIEKLKYFLDESISTYS